jgi:hypothetical protein
MEAPRRRDAACGALPSLARAALRSPYAVTPPRASHGFAAAAALEAQQPLAQAKELSQLLSDAAHKALGGGAAGALAMTANVAALMWMRTTIQFQYRRGSAQRSAAHALRQNRASADAAHRAPPQVRHEHHGGGAPPVRGRRARPARPAALLSRRRACAAPGAFAFVHTPR